jgi:hypothetical protein
MATRKSIVPAVAILALVGTAAFVVTTLAVSSASTAAPKAGLSFEHRFSAFSFTGSVTTSRPRRPRSFTLNFATAFTLAPDAPGVVNETDKTLGTLRVQEAVRYPVPSSNDFVGPARLPFGSRALRLRMRIRGACFRADPNGSYTFRGEARECAAASLALGKRSFNVISLLRRISGSFTPTSTDQRSWRGTLSATFRNPGYTFPVATLGRRGGTSFVIGKSGGSAATQSVSFRGRAP